VVASAFVSSALSAIIGRDCCPAVTSIGVRLSRAFTMLPIACPMPGVVWRFTTAGLPLACAQPSAMPTTTAS
jgi:hypothetical protein